MKRATLPLFALLLLAGRAGAQTPPPPRDAGRPVVEATRATGPIHVDGKLDEPAWAAAKPVDHFTQVDPEEGQPVSEPTIARILYDDEALYVGVRLEDSQPPTLRLGRRDMDLQDSDWLGVVIDSYHDHRTAFSLDLNPAGVQRDAVKSMGSGGTEHDDMSWDAVWEAKATVDDGGWTAEYRIPFSQLRFRDAPEQVWGIQIERIIGRRREYAVLSFTPKSEPGGIPTYANLVGLRDVEPGHRLEVMPYAVAKSSHVDPGPNPFRGRDENSVSAGLDLLYRVTSEMTLNATFNPDFGQVEADPAVVNLSTYETFFQEKRPFFVEGGEIFDFGRNTSGGQLFYSRRIGRAPLLRRGWGDLRLRPQHQRRPALLLQAHRPEPPAFPADGGGRRPGRHHHPRCGQVQREDRFGVVHGRHRGGHRPRGRPHHGARRDPRGLHGGAAEQLPGGAGAEGR